MAKVRRHKNGLVIRCLPNVVSQQEGKPNFNVYEGAKKRRPKKGSMVLVTK